MQLFLKGDLGQHFVQMENRGVPLVPLVESVRFLPLIPPPPFPHLLFSSLPFCVCIYAHVCACVRDVEQRMKGTFPVLSKNLFPSRDY